MDIKDSPNWEELAVKPDPKFQGGLKVGAETWSSDGSAQGNKIKALSDIKDFPGHIYLTASSSQLGESLISIILLLYTGTKSDSSG